MAAAIGYGVATTPRAPVTPQPAPQRPDIDWHAVTPGILSAVLFLVCLGASTLTSQGGQSTPPASRAQVEAEVERALDRVTTYTHNRETSLRLLSQCARENDGRDLNWVVDKVIYDITRDRR
jgi:hypothetical protein